MCDLCGGGIPAGQTSPDDIHGSSLDGVVGRRSLFAGLSGLASAGLLAACAGPGRASGTASVSPSALSLPGYAKTKLAVVLLGTQAGPPVDPQRKGIATALVVDGATYVIDCGRAAVTQYVESGLRFDSLKAIFLTHLHADHVADYYNFFLLGGHIKNIVGDQLVHPVQVYGPGPAGGLPAKFGGGTAPTVDPQEPTPGTEEMTQRLHEAYAYSDNVFLRDMRIPDIRSLTDVRELVLPKVGATYENRAPSMVPFKVMEDDRVKVTATLVPHGPVFPAFAFRFDTDHGSVTFSGDTRKTDNLTTLAKNTDLLIHEAINIRGVKLAAADRNHMLQSHVEVQEVGGVAQRAQAKRLILSHISNLGTPVNVAQWTKLARVGFDGRVAVGRDGQRVDVA